MQALPGILRENNYIPTVLDFGSPSEPKPLISVAVRYSSTHSKQVANICIEFGKLKFISGNGYLPGENAHSYSTFLTDGDKEKFITDFKNYVHALRIDTYCKMGFLIEEIPQPQSARTPTQRGFLLDVDSSIAAEYSRRVQDVMAENERIRNELQVEAAKNALYDQAAASVPGASPKVLDLLREDVIPRMAPPTNVRLDTDQTTRKSKTEEYIKI